MSSRRHPTGSHSAVRTPSGRHPTAASSSGAYSRLREPSRSGEVPRPRSGGPSWIGAVLATAAVASSLIFVAWAKMETVQITYAIDALIDREEELANEQRRLRSELASLRSPRALHALAPELGLSAPEPGHVVVVTGDPEGLSAVLAAAESEEEAIEASEEEAP